MKGEKTNEIDRKLDKLFDAVEALINMPLRGHDKSKIGIREWAEANKCDGSLSALQGQVKAGLLEGSYDDFYSLLKEWYRLMGEIVGRLRKEQVEKAAQAMKGEVIRGD